MKVKKRKALYLRKSRQGEEMDALMTHRATLVDLAKRHGFDEYDIFEEIASGDAEKEKLEKIKSNIELYDGVLCMDIDRLSRNKIESFEIELLFGENGVKVYTPSQTYDFADDSQNMMYSFKAIFANAEHKKIKQRMKAGKINRFRNGEYSMGRPPLGYKIENKRLVIDPYNAEKVKRIFELCAQGLGRVAIENEVGVNEGQLKHIWKNKTYIGQVEVNFYDGQGNVTETLTQSCDPIIDIELFVKCQEEIRRRDRNPARTRGGVKSFIQGMFRCSACGCQLVISNNGGKGHYIVRCQTRKCPTSGIRLDYVENYIINEIEDACDVLNDLLVEKMKTSTPSTLPNELDAVRGEIGALEGKLKRVKDAYFDADINKEEYKERKSSLDMEINNLNLKLQALELKIARDDKDQAVKDLIDLLDDVEDFEDKTLEEKHLVMKRLVDRIEYSRSVPKTADRRTTTLMYPPTIKVIYREF
ncbi:recombinase family protein [Bacillus sp. sid0103]|uniref:recombinase family protein n=1 Tax=Bacillus sp. sid0103 TaxID=2856337 RepID=UPI001C4699BC|nr:recombinase family protein [Bacillus sp. sid0103]MBV7504692.1 recombinase family protein [Bacillus sp. sid0103]